MMLYFIVLECIITKEIDESVVFLRKKEYNNMLLKINEVVYRENNKEWALKKITKNK